MVHNDDDFFFFFCAIILVIVPWTFWVNGVMNFVFFKSFSPIASREFWYKKKCFFHGSFVHEMDRLDCFSESHFVCKYSAFDFGRWIFFHA